MSRTPTRNIALTDELEAYIKAQVASGRYGNASEVVRNGLRLMIEHDETRQLQRTTAAQVGLARRS